MEGVPKLALVQTQAVSSPMSQDTLVARLLMQPYFFQAQTASETQTHCHNTGKVEFLR